MGTEPDSDKKEPDRGDQCLDIPADSSSTSVNVVKEISAFQAYVRIFGHAAPVDRALQVIAVVAAIASGAGIASQNLIFGEFITTITNYVSGQTSPSQLRERAAQLSLYFVYLGIGRFVLSYTYNTLFTFTSYRIVRHIRHAYLRAALSQEIAFFDAGTSGSVATQATSNGRLIQGGISEKFGLVFQGMSSFITAFTIAFVVQWKLTLICLCIAPATLIVNGMAAGFMAGYETGILQIQAQSNDYAENFLSSARTVHAFEMRTKLIKRFNEYLTDAHNLGKKISPLFGMLLSTEYCIIYLGYGLAFWQGIRMLARGEIEDSGTIFIVILSVIVAATNLTALAPYSIDFTRAATAAAQLYGLIDRESQIGPFSKSGQTPASAEGELEFENITFAYPTRPGVTVLDSFSLKFPRSKVIALVGPSGSGKSTVIGLIERWYDAQSGTIKLDGCPIDQLNLNWLRQNVRLVQQEPVLFQGSVLDNIKYGLIGTPWENASHEEQMARVQKAAKQAYAHDFISNLPNGYLTNIGQRGGLLSGGQKQRIAIARSIISEPRILLLDEATSALDPEAEAIVQKALDSASEGRTTIVVAHKLATIRNADQIVVMAKGQIVEQGTHQSLISNDGSYARLVKIQDLQPQEAMDNAEAIDDRAKESLHITRTSTHRTRSGDDYMDSQAVGHTADSHKQLGIFSVIVRLVRATPELTTPYLFVVAGCALAGGTFPGQAILIASIVDVFALTGSEMEREGSFYATMFIVLGAGCLVAYFAIGYASNMVAHHLSHKYRRETLEEILRQDIEFFDREENNTGALASRVDSYPQSILELMGYNISLILVTCFNMSACAILAIAFTWRFGLVLVLAGLPPLVGTGFLKIRSDARLDRDMTKRHEKSAAIASEAIAAIRTVSSLTIEEEVLRRYTKELNQAIADSKRPLFTSMLYFASTQAIEYWFLALGIWYGCRLLSEGETDMYAFFIAFLGVFFSGQAASQLFQYSTSITKGVNAANYIFWLKDQQPVMQQTPENQCRGPEAGAAVDLVDISFSYPHRSDKLVLKGLNLQAKKGQFIALVGPSGCGKSTVVGLLERFYDPDSGSINVDSSPLTSFNPRLYRNMVALVQQEPVLFKSTILENVLLGLGDDSEASMASTAGTSTVDEQVESSLRAANAWEFVSSLPEGISTPIGKGGTQLSGGQRQRIAIARALIRNPKILILDEATSALDTESEKLVQDALAKAARDGDRITFAVAHRLSTIRDADLICVFSGGRIKEMGTHRELIARDTEYGKMCAAQALE